MTVVQHIGALVVLVNVALFSHFFRVNQLPLDAGIFFLGYIFANAPAVLAIHTANKAHKTLSGHWLNVLNIFIPVVVCTAGFYAYGFLAFQPGATAVIFLYGPMLIGVIWWLLLAVLIQIFVLLPRRE